MMDVESDGKITMQEFMDLEKIEGFDLSSKSIKTSFREMDTDGSNKWAVELLLATTEYPRFFGLMKNEAKRQMMEKSTS